MRQTLYNFYAEKQQNVKQKELLGDVDIRSLSQETKSEGVNEIMNSHKNGYCLQK